MGSFMSRLWRERLTWFVLIGLVLFAMDMWRQDRDDHVIKISLPLVEKLVAQWTAQTKRPPSPQDLDMLLEGYIREEILVREALRRDMNVDDVIIRRRLAQKMEFVLGEDELSLAQPSEELLRDFYQSHINRFTSPARLSFQHIYLAQKIDLANDVRLKVNAQPEIWRELGFPFMLQREYLDRSFEDIAEIFGGAFATDLFAYLDGQWSAPMRSAYGVHLVRIIDRQAEVTPEFSTMIDQVAAQYIADKEKQARDAAWQELRTAYEIEFLPVPDAVPPVPQPDAVAPSRPTTPN